MDLAAIVPLGPNDTWPKALVGLLVSHSIPVVLSATQPKPDGLPQAVRWLQSDIGRPQQLNYAIGQTHHPWLWLIHADSQMSSRAISTALKTYPSLSPLTIAYGRLRFAHDGPIWTRLNAWGANMRSNWLGRPYGDQSLLLHRTLWESLGGFSETLSRGEDLDFIIRAKRLGARTQRLPITVTTSARRYQAMGWLKTTLHHQIQAYRIRRQARRWSP